MAAPTSAVDVCNLALDLLKQDATITSIETPVTEAETICARWYDETRRSVLRGNAWNFAIKRAILAPSVEVPVFGYSKKFPLPNDFVRLLTLGDDNTVLQSAEELELLDYQMEDNAILLNTDSDQLKMRYIFDIKNVVKFDSMFVGILSHTLAINMATRFTGNQNLKAQLENSNALQELKTAAVDGQERTPKRIERSSFIAARSRRGTTGSTAFGGTVIVF